MNFKNLPAGFTNVKELEWLYQKVATLKDNSCIVELGSWLGRSAVVMAQSLKDHKNNSVIWCIDNWNEKYSHQHDIKNSFDLFLDATEKYDNILVSKTESSDSDGFMFDEVDMIFIDADHSYESVKNDLLSWHMKLSDNCILCGHDYRRGLGVEEAVKEYAIKYGKKIKTIKGGTIWELV
jgi:predicted O-methyltransferase YrrM